MTRDEWKQLQAEWEADLKRVLAEEPDPELLALAEQVVASQVYAPKTPEEIEAWAARLAADLVAAGEAEGWA